MNLKYFNNICSVSRTILSRYKNSKHILSISNLHITKPHPVFISQLSLLKKDKWEIDNQRILVRIKDILKSIFNESADYYPNLDLKEFKNLNNEKCLFLSHIINTSHLNFKKDFYFGELPFFLSKKKYTTKCLLRNFTNKSSKSIFQDNKKNFNKNLIILSKSIKIFKELKLIFELIKTFLKLKKFKLIDKDLRRFLFNKSDFKSAASIFNNFKLLYQVEKVIKNFKPDHFFLTLEGHAWEKLLISQIKKNHPNIKIYAYQFSTLTKYSNSIFLDLGKNYLPDVILNTGIYPRKKFLKSYKSKIKCINIGSNKFLSYRSDDKKTRNILVIPEGVNSETLRMLNFTIDAANKFSSLKFFFRFHPIIEKNLFFKNLYYQKKIIPKNLIFSNKTFIQDLQSSKFILYRGSASAVQGLGCGKIPLYLKFENEINIDPLFMIKKKFYINNLKDLQMIINDKKIKYKNFPNKFFPKKYFDKPQFQNLLKIMQKTNEKI